MHVVCKNTRKIAVLFIFFLNFNQLHLSRSFTIRLELNLSFDASVVKISNVFCHCVSMTLCKRSAMSLLEMKNTNWILIIEKLFFSSKAWNFHELCGDNVQ